MLEFHAFEALSLCRQSATIRRTFFGCGLCLSCQTFPAHDESLPSSRTLFRKTVRASGEHASVPALVTIRPAFVPPYARCGGVPPCDQMPAEEGIGR